jgi:hypothetical protein
MWLNIFLVEFLSSASAVCKQELQVCEQFVVIDKDTCTEYVEILNADESLSNNKDLA